MRTRTTSKPLPAPGAGVTGTLLDSDAALREGVAALAALDPVMARLVAEGAEPALRKRPPGFAGLAGIVVSQQISTASAAAIWARLTARLPDLTAEALATAPDEALREAGLSAPKIRTLRAAAQAVAEGALPLNALHALPADEAHRRMVAVHGIGPWTADVYLLFCLGHPDAFPAGDLALQEAARLADGLEARPSAAALTARAEAWRPWRGVAAKVLWAYYRVAKARDGAPLPG
ncbi:DNA-3-methyladenine glycosylase family protein [Methylobacterium nonmethylotrophicum]|uniref:DNA-3-methyladenine glycosylase II n=1 Tax=Methylobacterium nonmethylotrophicum TaxID=1141884 RepID=A0A4Z0NTV7_9HYPH|nr:DNA-3-methyladenine glycosylase [Methylobacterium nonmethylotrophicum]TGE00209.1 DNA-3-methyladenine glycosylase 2 family protein [Methylobacterium nonmethylotrophicum]